MKISPVPNVSIEMSFFYTEQVANLISFPVMLRDLLYLICLLINGQLNCPASLQVLINKISISYIYKPLINAVMIKS